MRKGIEEWRESGHKSRGRVARKLERRRHWVWKVWAAECPKAAWSPPQQIPLNQPWTEPHHRKDPTSPLVPLVVVGHGVLALSVSRIQLGF